MTVESKQYLQISHNMMGKKEKKITCKLRSTNAKMHWTLLIQASVHVLHNSSPTALFSVGLEMLIGSTFGSLMLYKRDMAAGCLSYKTGVCVHMQQAFVCPRPDVQPLLCLHVILKRRSPFSPWNASFTQCVHNYGTE